MSLKNDSFCGGVVTKLDGTLIEYDYKGNVVSIKKPKKKTKSQINPDQIQ